MLSEWIASEEVALISPADRVWLLNVFERFQGYPTLEQLWALMDAPWLDLECDSSIMDARIGAFYSHPVWLLNGLFIEQHDLSIENRQRFAEWVVNQNPKRVAEFGGGFGGLARKIGGAMPSVEIEVIEPHPHPIAIARAEKTANVRYHASLNEEYDVMIATDVFEHVPDPLQLVADTAEHLRAGGQYLIANCFYPVILCHLPQTFHFRYSWSAMMKAIGLKPVASVAYGQVFRREGEINLEAGRRLERISQSLWPYTQHLPSRLGSSITKAWLAAVSPRAEKN